MKKCALSLFFSLIISFFSYAQDKNEDLYKAITNKDKPAVSRLLADHANPSYVRSASRFQKTDMLITAVKAGDSEVVRMLVDKGAELEWKDTYGRTALMYAVAANKATIVDLLLEVGANVNANDGKGYSVLTAAKDSGDDDMKALIEDKIEELKKKEPGAGQK